MFILYTNDIGTTMFVKQQKIESDINLWHKRLNFPKLQEMQAKHVVFGLLKFSGLNGQLCEAC